MSMSNSLCHKNIDMDLCVKPPTSSIEMSIIDKLHKENVDRIIGVLKEHEDSLTGGYEFHVGDDALFKIAEEIIDVLPLEVY